MSGQKLPTGEATTDRGGSGQTSGVCAYSGPYKCSSHPEIIVSFQRGQKFHPCPAALEMSKAGAGHATTWVMVRETDADAFSAAVQRAESL